MVDDVKKDFQNIKAGVEGVVADIPDAPSAPEAPAAPAEDFPEPKTITSGEGYQDITPDAPSMNYNQSMPSATSSGLDVEKMHSIIERVVTEKWDDMMSRIGDIGSWKQKVEINLTGVKQEIIRLSGRLENTQNSVLGKIGDYDKGIRDIHSEMKALEKVFEKIMDPLVTNIKDLQKITDDMKKHSRK